MEIGKAIEEFLWESWKELHTNKEKHGEHFEVLKSEIRNHAKENGVELFDINFTKAHTDETSKVLYQIASTAGVVDSEGHIIEMSELKKAAFDYVKRSRKGDQNHDFQKVLDMVESLVFDETIIKAVKEGKIKAGDWVVGWELDNEELLQKALAGEITGASIAGFARLEAVE